MTIELLQGNANYDLWSLTLRVHLNAQGLLDYTQLDFGLDTTKDALQRNLAYSTIVLSLSSNVKGLLSAEARDFINPQPKLLWDELKRSYSDEFRVEKESARKERLLSLLWGTRIPAGEDPNPAMTTIQQTAEALRNSGTAVLPDEWLTYTLLHALPASYRNMKAHLLTIEPLGSEQVISSIDEEWRRQRTR